MSFWVGLDYYHWLLLGLLLLVIEVATGGGFLMWLGFSALTTGLLVLVLPWLQLPLSWQWQLVVFAIGCVLAVMLWWKYFHWSSKSQPASSLNRRGSDLVGREARLKGALENGVGHVMIDGVRWQVTGPDLPDGTQVRLVQLNDLIFVVEALNK